MDRNGTKCRENIVEETKRIKTNNYIPSGNSIPRDIPSNQTVRARSRIPASVTNISFGQNAVGLQCAPNAGALVGDELNLGLLGPRARNGLAHLEKSHVVGGVNKQRPTRIPKPGNSNYSFFRR